MRYRNMSVGPRWSANGERAGMAVQVDVPPVFGVLLGEVIAYFGQPFSIALRHQSSTYLE